MVASSIEVATTFWGRFRGLMGRRSLADGEGLYLTTASIHMLFMRFPIDALFVGPADDMGLRTVLAVRNRLPPWRGMVLPVRGAAGVVELPAGTVLAASLGRGDRVRLVPSLA
ncbi:MAG: DUF192 domain-containing protein [Chloroflexota bacterium]|nr:DUF192 domain-containing protein [Chloroflexota bacterium]